MPTTTTALCIRADATPTIGAGHVMRCLALAQAAHRQGMHAKIVGRIQIPWLLERLQHKQILYKLLHDPLPAAEEPARLLKDIEDTDWVILDGYHFTYECQQAVCRSGKRLLLIDDYAHLPEYICDILLNQNIGAEAFVYRGHIGNKLLGPRYALLRQEFEVARERAGQRRFSEKVRNILLTLGGGDFSRHLERIAPVFALSELEGRTLRVIPGAMPREFVRTCLYECPAHVEVVEEAGEMAEHFLWADLCVTAGGSTCWELSCLGVPFLTVETAKNQRHIISGLATGGYAPEFCCASLRAGLDSCGLRARREALFGLTTGVGAKLVLAAMQGES